MILCHEDTKALRKNFKILCVFVPSWQMYLLEIPLLVQAVLHVNFIKLHIFIYIAFSRSDL